MSEQPEKRVPAYRDPKAMPLFRNPPVGTLVQWYPHADVTEDDDRVCAALITSNDGPGIVSLTVFSRNAGPVYRQGVRHVSDPFHITKKESTMRSGGWDFVPDYTPDRLPAAASVKRVAEPAAVKK